MCPDCKSDRISERGARPGFYHCNACNFDFTVRTGTIFERSKVPLHKWVYAMYLLVTARKGISSMQLAKEIDVTQKTAWFILGRLHEACSAPGWRSRVKTPAGLDLIADVVLGYRPKAQREKSAKRRKRAAKKAGGKPNERRRA